MKKALIIVLVIIAAIAAVEVSRKVDRPKSSNNQVFKIGISLPLTGSVAHLGESGQKGIGLAAEELKRDHPNLNLQYYLEDNAFTGNSAVSAYRKLKDSDNIDAIITATSPASLATEPLAKQDNILQMAIFASTPKYSSPNDLSFRILPRAEKEAEALAEYAHEKQLQRVAVVYINNDFGQGLASSINAKFAQNGSSVKIVSQESYLPDTTDFKTLLAKVKQSNPQALFMFSPAQDVVSLMRQGRALGLNGEFLASVAASDPAVLNTSPDTQGLLVTDIFDPQSTDRNVQDFIRSFKQKFGTTPDLFAVQGYDGYELTALALEKCGRNADCIKSYLFGLKDYPTILGNLTFDINGDPDYHYFLKVFNNGQFERVKE